MATPAFVLIGRSIGKTKDVVNTLKGLKAMKSVDVAGRPNARGCG